MEEILYNFLEALETLGLLVVTELATFAPDTHGEWGDSQPLLGGSAQMLFLKGHIRSPKHDAVLGTQLGSATCQASTFSPVLSCLLLLSLFIGPLMPPIGDMISQSPHPTIHRGETSPYELGHGGHEGHNIP